MIPILKTQNDKTILTSDVEDIHIVVANIQGLPCILGKGYYEPIDKLTFYKISNNDNPIITYGNGVDFCLKGKTRQSIIEKAIELGHSVEVFKQKDWKQALQWLIDNTP